MVFFTTIICKKNLGKDVNKTLKARTIGLFRRQDSSLREKIRIGSQQLFKHFFRLLLYNGFDWNQLYFTLEPRENI